MSELTARVIGADGRMGQEHVAAYRECNVDVVAGDADIVSIASPDNTHAEYVIKALERGSHVFCEKPVATNAKDLRKMCKIAVRERLALWQHFPLRYQPIFKTFKKNLKSFGDIYRVEASYNWGRTDKLNYSWRANDPDYSLVLGGMIHVIDLVDWLFDGEMDVDVASVAATNKSAPGFAGKDTVMALCLSEDDVICNFIVDGGRGVKTHNHRLLVHGTKGGQTVVNHEPTDKRAMIRDFVKNVRKGEHHLVGMEATAAAIAIDSATRVQEIEI